MQANKRKKLSVIYIESHRMFLFLLIFSSLLKKKNFYKFSLLSGNDVIN